MGDSNDRCDRFSPNMCEEDYHRTHNDDQCDKGRNVRHVPLTGESKKKQDTRFLGSKFF